MTDEGYERMVPEQSTNAVRWWYTHRDGDYRFARGGLCRTARRARHHLQDARDQMLRERDGRALALRPRFKLLADGELEQIWPPT